MKSDSVDFVIIEIERILEDGSHDLVLSVW